MNETLVLTPERILEATEEVLRRYGLAKATGVDGARGPDGSHGRAHRHFPGETALRAGGGTHGGGARSLASPWAGRAVPATPGRRS